jgi:hypothetical protein
VLRPAGRFVVAAVWAGPERCDSVRFQQTAGSFPPTPPASSLDPGALADPAPFLAQLAATGIVTRIETVLLSFEFGTCSAAWEALAGVTAAGVAAERRAEAQAATRVVLGWDDLALPNRFDNPAHLLIGIRKA